MIADIIASIDAKWIVTKEKVDILAKSAEANFVKWGPLIRYLEKEMMLIEK